MARTMKSIRGVLVLLGGCGPALLAGSMPVDAARQPSLSVTVGGVRPGGVIPSELAFCIPATQGHVALGPNKSPAIRWSKGPAGTASYAIIMHDSDVPSVADDVNKEGKIVPAKLKRVNFYHWILVDIPAGLALTGLPLGADSNGVTAQGKPPGPSKFGVRGVNDYTNWFASDPKMAGTYAGYDGPCPPWNDAIVHRYHFTVYALNVANLGLSGKFSGTETLNAMRTHVLAKGEAVGIYTLNPAVGKRIGGK